MIDRVGQQLGNYRLLRLLGQGGQASVYLGEHIYLKSQAALKVRHAALTEEEQTVFLQEAQTLVRLTHPHIVRVLDFALQDDMPFLVMEYASHGTLRKLHPKGTRLPLDLILPYVNQVASALQYTHDQRLIHRDVKPENMLLTSHDQVRLSDFGLVMHAPQSLSPDATEPMEQSLAGTTPYLSPEQLRGKAQPASDQYALGVVIYEWLCGKPPFQGSFLEVAVQHVSAPPPSLREQVPNLSPALEEVVLRALAKEPELRFLRVQDFAAALEQASQQADSPRLTPVLVPEHRAEAEQRLLSRPDLPTGTVTFLFTDIEGSTTRWEHHPDAMRTALARHDSLLRQTITGHNGYVFKMVGDAVYAAFAIPADAVAAAVAAQRAVAAEEWGEVAPLLVRMALHTGTAQSRDDDYFGPTLNRVARVLSTGYGGQTLLSVATVELIRDALPAGASLKDLGEHALKDLLRPEHIYQLTIPDLLADFPALKSLSRHPQNLPVQPTPFLGREQEVASVCALFSRPEVRLVTLTGPGGIGKTRLSLQVAAEGSEQFADGVFFVALAPVSDAELVVPTIMQTLSIKEVGGQSPLGQLKAGLKDKQMLLLLDNFEQVVDAAVVVAELLVACPKLKIMVTSRVVLHVQAEREYAVPSLSLPDPKHLPDLVALSQYEAVALFIERAQAVKADFAVTNANAPAVAGICARLDGLPLAIELAAARAKFFAPQALLSRLEQGLALLIGGARDVPARQQTLRAAIAWSYDLLSPQEQVLFQRLSVFVDGWTWEAAEVVCRAAGELEADMLESLLLLVDKSLLRQQESTEGEPRFWMLQLLREFGQEALMHAGESEVTRQGHAEYYLALAEQAEPHLKGAEQGRWYARLEQEQDNLRAALAWFLEAARKGLRNEEERQQAERALRLCAALSWFWYTRGRLREGWTALSQSLAAGAGVAALVRARALCAAADLWLTREDMDRAQARVEEGLALFRELGDTAGIAHALEELAVFSWMKSQYAVARSQLEEANVLFQEVGNTWNRGRCLTQLARIATAQGEYDRAHTLLEESRGLYSALGDQYRVGWVLYLLARVLFLSGSNLAGAQRLAEQSLALLRPVGDESFYSHTSAVLNLLGQLRLQQGEQARARELFEASLAMQKTLGNLWTLAEALIGLARVAALQDEVEEAYARYQESLVHLHELDHKELIPACLEGLADMVAAQRELAWAVRLWGAAEALREAGGTPLPPIERADYERAIAAVRTRLDEKAFTTAWAEGRTMTLEQVLTAKGPVTVPTPGPIESPSIPASKPVVIYPDGLTAREVEVLRFVAKRLTDAQIAEQLVISPRTVNTHLTSIYSKIQVSSRSAATRYAIEHQLV